jgi:hypothetical protein
MAAMKSCELDWAMNLRRKKRKGSSILDWQFLWRSQRMATTKLLVPPAETPVTVAEAKDYLRVDGNLEDGRIDTMIKAATQRLEEFCDQKFISQTWAQYLDTWPTRARNIWWDGVRELPISELYAGAGEIELLIGPVQSITEFNTYADDGVAQLFPSSNYIFDNSGTFGRIALPLGGVWPTTILRKLNGIEIKMICGIASAASDVPSSLKQAVLELVAHLYEHRGDEKQVAIPSAVALLCQPYKRTRLGFNGY